MRTTNPFTKELVNFVQNECEIKECMNAISEGFWFILHESGQWQAIDNELNLWWGFLGDDFETGDEVYDSVFNKIDWEYLDVVFDGYPIEALEIGPVESSVFSPITNIYYIEDPSEIRKCLLTYMKESGIYVSKKYNKYLK